jgi:hypothetical protein
VPRAGQDSRWYPSGVRAVFAFELVGGPCGDLLIVELAVDGVIAKAGGGGDERLWERGQYQVPSTSRVPPVLAWMPSWSAR